MNKATRSLIRDGSIMLALWFLLWLTTGNLWASGTLVAIAGWLQSARARVLIHRYIQDHDISVLPLLNAPESDVAYITQQNQRKMNRQRDRLQEQLEQINTALR